MVIAHGHMFARFKGHYRVRSGHTQRFQNTPRVWASIILIMVIANFTDFALKLIRRRYFAWEA